MTLVFYRWYLVHVWNTGKLSSFIRKIYIKKNNVSDLKFLYFTFLVTPTIKIHVYCILSRNAELLVWYFDLHMIIHAFVYTCSKIWVYLLKVLYNFNQSQQAFAPETIESSCIQLVTVGDHNELILFLLKFIIN